MNAKIKSRNLTKGVALLLAVVMIVGIAFSAHLFTVGAKAVDEAGEPTGLALDHSCDYGYYFGWIPNEDDGILYLRRICGECHEFDASEFYNVKYRDELTVTGALVDKGITSENKIRDDFRSALADIVTSGAKIEWSFRDLYLTVGADSQPAGAGKIPADGKIPVRITARELTGFDPAKHTVYVLHMAASDAYGVSAGTIEVFTVADGTLTVENGVLSFETIGFSPIAIAFTCKDHVDLDKNHECDTCKEISSCVDEDPKDKSCDVCGEKMKADQWLLILLAILGVLVVGGTLITVCYFAWLRKDERRWDEPKRKFACPVKEAELLANRDDACTRCKSAKSATDCRQPSTGGYYGAPCNMMPPPALPASSCPVAPYSSSPCCTTLAAVNPAVAAEWHPCRNGALRPTDVSCSSREQVWWRCRRGHEWKSPVYLRNAGEECPHCTKQKR